MHAVVYVFHIYMYKAPRIQNAHMYLSLRFDVFLLLKRRRFFILRHIKKVKYKFKLIQSLTLLQPNRM